MEKADRYGAKEIIIGFIQRFRIILIGIVGLVIIGLVTLIVVEEVKKSQVSANTSQIESLDNAYAEYTNAKDDAGKKSAEESFDLIYKDVTGAFSRSIEDQRASYLKGLILMDKKDWAGAEKEFSRGSKLISNSYLTPVLLFNASEAAEKNTNIDSAISYLNDLVKNYAQKSPFGPRAYFNLGRLFESQQKWKDAAAAYQNLVDSYTASNWTKFSEDRIIYLKSQSKL